MRLHILDAIWLFNPISQKESGLCGSSDDQQKREYRRRHECDRDATAIDQDATALCRCEEFAGSAPKVETPMRSMGTHCIHVFRPTRHVAK
jgi:hypothetical protein